MPRAVTAESSVVLVFGSVPGRAVPLTLTSRPPLALGPGVGGDRKPGAPGGTTATNVFVEPVTVARTQTQPLGNVEMPPGGMEIMTLGPTLGLVPAGTGCVNAI